MLSAPIKWKFCLRRREGIFEDLPKFSCAPHNFPAFPAACIFSKKWKSFSVKIYHATKFDLVQKIGNDPSCYEKFQFLEKRI